MNASPPRGTRPSTCPLCASPLTHDRCTRCGAAACPGGFQVHALLSQSPHGRLYVAEAPDGSRVALKELVFAVVPDAKQLEAFEREASLLRQVSHPRIPRFVAHFQEGEGVHTRLYLAQQFVEGTPLGQLPREHLLTEDEAFDLARQVLEVLQYLHGRSPPIVHRDIKPANLVRREDGELFLVDFGAARDLWGHRTASATLVGTFEYMPPEQLGGTVDATSDLYALGATLIHLLGRRSPETLRGPDLELRFEPHVSGSQRLHRFLRKLVARDPAARFPSALDALLALESPSGDGRPLRPWRRYAVAAAAVLLGAGVPLFQWFAPAPPEDRPALVASAPAPRPVSPPDPVTPPTPASHPDMPDEEPAEEESPEEKLERLGFYVREPVPTNWEPEGHPVQGFDMAARWNFNEFDGEPFIHDELGWGRVKRTLVRVPGMWEGALWCHGTGSDSGFVTRKNKLRGLEEGSLAVWIRRDAPTSKSWVFAIEADGSRLAPALFFEKDGLLHFNAAWPEDLVAPQPFQQDVFHHVAATWGKGGTRLYVDGKLIASDTRPGRLPTMGQFVKVCGDPEGRDRSPELTLDELSLFRREFTPEAVTTLVAAGRDRTRVRKLLVERFEQKPERWTSVPNSTDAKVRFETFVDRGESVFRVWRRLAAGGAGPITTWTPPWRIMSREKKLWLEYDVRVDAHEPGPRSLDVPAQGLVLQLELENEKSEKLLYWIGHSPYSVRPPPNAPVRQRQVRRGQWLRHERVELTGLFGRGAPPFARLVRVTVFGHGVEVEGELDNFALVAD